MSGVELVALGSRSRSCCSTEGPFGRVTGSSKVRFTSGGITTARCRWCSSSSSITKKTAPKKYVHCGGGRRRRRGRGRQHAIAVSGLHLASSSAYTHQRTGQPTGARRRPKEWTTDGRPSGTDGRPSVAVGALASSSAYTHQRNWRPTDARRERRRPGARARAPRRSQAGSAGDSQRRRSRGGPTSCSPSSGGTSPDRGSGRGTHSRRRARVGAACRARAPRGRVSASAAATPSCPRPVRARHAQGAQRNLARSRPVPFAAHSRRVAPSAALFGAP